MANMPSILIWIIIIVTLQYQRALSEIIEVPNLALYHMTPENDDQLRYLNRLRTSDSGLLFIHGVGTVGETVEVIAPPSIMDHFDRELDEIKLEYDMQFNPVSIEMFNNETKEIPGSTAENSPTLPTSRELMEIEPISPPVYSGVFISISHSIPNHSDPLSFSVKWNSTMGNPYLCLSTESTGKEGDAAKQWLFERTESDGLFALRNRKIPNGYVTWDDDDEPLLVIETRLELQRQYSVGGKMRNNVLFRLNKTITDKVKGPVFEMTIVGTDMENMSIIIDRKLEKTSGCVLLRRGHKSTDPGNIEHLFKIQRPHNSVKVIGHLEDFKYKETVNDLFERAQREGTLKSITSRKVFNHGDEMLKLSIEDVHERLDRFHLKFQNSMEGFDALWVPPGLSIGTPTTSVDSRVNKGVHASVKLNKVSGKDTVAKIKYLISGNIQIPSWSWAEYAIVFGWINKLDLGFDATLRITGKGDRMTKGSKPKVVPDQPVNVNLIKRILQERGFRVDVSAKWKETHSSSPDNVMSYEIPIQGNIFAWTLGIKGEVEMSVTKLSSDVNATCRTREP